MGHFVALTGSFTTGFVVFGPYDTRDKAERDTLERQRGGWCDSPLAEVVPLILDDATTEGPYILILGDLKDGIAVYGTYSGPSSAANASSPFRPDPINPNTPDGQRQAGILGIRPPHMA
jgi:hypothetical protein